MLRKEIENEMQRRSILNDDFFDARQDTKTKIPNIVHYVWFGCRTFRFHHYLSMKSVINIQKPESIFLHTNCKPSGKYFNELEDSVTIVKRSPPDRIWDRSVEKIEHKSDVARLQILMEHGGIYLDDDVLILKPLTDLLENEMVLGEENYDALANTIILASKDSWFLKRWYWEYRNFDDNIWSHHSCFVPWSIWHLFPDSINVQKEKMLR